MSPSQNTKSPVNEPKPERALASPSVARGAADGVRQWWASFDWRTPTTGQREFVLA